jgi:cell division protein FtsQ
MTRGTIRRLAAQPWAWVVLGVLVLALLLACLRYAPLFSVEQISVTGNQQVTSAEVVAAADIAPGTRVLDAPLDAIAGRVESLDAVADATVTRNWPNGLRVVVHERRPVGYVRMSEGFGLVGSDGSVYRVESAAPRNLPQLPDATVAQVGDPYRSRMAPTTVPAFEVATALPHRLQRRLGSVSTTSDGAVVMTDDAGVTLSWGDSQQNATKAEVVLLLMAHKGWGTEVTAVDVSAPQAPALD